MSILARWFKRGHADEAANSLVQVRIRLNTDREPGDVRWVVLELAPKKEASRIPTVLEVARGCLRLVTRTSSIIISILRFLKMVARYLTTSPASKTLRKLQEEDDEPELDVVDGRLGAKQGVALRLAREVKLRFGGTPTDNEANHLLAARYIQDAMDDHGITRKLDKAKILYRTRALVFVPLPEEVEEAELRNCREARQCKRDLANARGWLPRWWSR